MLSAPSLAVIDSFERWRSRLKKKSKGCAWLIIKLRMSQSTPLALLRAPRRLYCSGVLL